MYFTANVDGMKDLWCSSAAWLLSTNVTLVVPLLLHKDFREQKMSQ